MKKFLVIGLDSGVPWPTKKTRVLFKEHEIVLRPATEELAPTVVMEYKSPITIDEAIFIVRCFLSSLSWVKGGYLRETVITGGGAPINVGKMTSVNLISPDFRVDYLPDFGDPKAQLALALYREALNVNSIPYKFLGFFKIINLVHKTGPDQIAWINETIKSIKEQRAGTRLAVLRDEQNDIGRYLYESGRCAVAHAFSDPLVDPDDPRDTNRLSADLCVMQALAEYLIEHELKILSQRTVWREHLYELEGFRTLIGSEVVNQFKEKQDIEIKGINAFPKLSIRLRDHERLKAFDKMTVEVIGCSNGRLLVRCVSPDQRVVGGLSLNFVEERLELDPLNSVEITDDGSAEAVSHKIDRISLVRGLLNNGQLEVWDSDGGILLGRCDPHIPVNIDVTRTEENLDRITDRLRSELTRRSTSESKK